MLFCYASGTPALDIVTLSDGDRLTGTIQRLESGTLFFKSRYGEAILKIGWPLVSGVSSDTDFQATLRDGTTSKQKLAQLRHDDVLTFEPVEKGRMPSEGDSTWLGRAWQNSTVSADFGQSYSGLSGYNQFSATSETIYAGDRWDGTVVTHFDHYGSSGSSASAYQTNGRLVAQRYIRGDHFFLFPFAFVGRQTKEDGRGQLRQYGGGVGWTFHRQQDNQLSFYGGAIRSFASGYRTPESSEPSRGDLRNDEPLYVAAVAWDSEWKSKTNLSVKLFYFKPMRQAGHHGMTTEASLKVPLFGPAYFTVRAYDTPEIGQSQLFSRRNLQVSSGIGIEFK